MIAIESVIETVRESTGETVAQAKDSIERAILHLNAMDDGMPSIVEVEGQYHDDDADMICEYIRNPESVEEPEAEAQMNVEATELAGIEQRATLTTFADEYWRADQWRRHAMADLQTAIREAAASTSEAEMTRISGLTRMTVRKALGKG